MVGAAAEGGVLQRTIVLVNVLQLPKSGLDSGKSLTRVTRPSSQLVAGTQHKQSPLRPYTTEFTPWISMHESCHGNHPKAGLDGALARVVTQELLRKVLPSQLRKFVVVVFKFRVSRVDCSALLDFTAAFPLHQPQTLTSSALPLCQAVALSRNNKFPSN